MKCQPTINFIFLFINISYAELRLVGWLVKCQPYSFENNVEMTQRGGKGLVKWGRREVNMNVVINILFHLCNTLNLIIKIRKLINIPKKKVN